MTDYTPKNQKLLYIASAIVAVAGIAAAVVIYLTAPDAPEDALADFEGSKAYIHQLEIYGGKTNVMMSQFMQWFGGLWHGKTLAFPVAFTAIFISACLFLIAKLSEVDPDSD